MHLLFDESDLPSIKESLRKAHPDTKPSHRMEAAAKGLGYSTYAGLLASLKVGRITVAVDDAVFCSSLNVPRLTEKGRPIRSLSRAVARAMLRRALEEHPNLTERGFDSIWQGSNAELRKPREELEAMFAERRREASEGDWSADQFELALIFLSRQRKIKSISRQSSSYGLKHRAENLSREFGMFTHLGDYVSNGMLIAAAIVSGFAVRRIAYDSYSAHLNISMQTVRTARGRERFSRTENPEIVKAMYAEP